MAECLFPVAAHSHIDITISPANLSDANWVRLGAGSYAAMCVECHLAPGKANSEIRKGLYSEMPDLSQSNNLKVDAASSYMPILDHKTWHQSFGYARAVVRTVCRTG